MSFFAFKVDPREAQYARLVFGVFGALRAAVDKRTKEGLTQTAIAKKAGIDKSSLTRILKGRSQNLTLKTVSDILWACDFEPVEFEADALEDLSSSHVPDHLRTETAAVEVRMCASYGLQKAQERHTLQPAQ